MKRGLIICLLVCFLGAVFAVPAAQAFGLGDILKVGGIAILVDKFATPLNNFINSLTAKNGVSSEYSTKVVPIITIGTGGYVGAVQVTGPQHLVEQTQAVIQIEADFDRQFRIKALIPIDSKNPTNFNRVQGVGVSAMIDVRI